MQPLFFRINIGLSEAAVRSLDVGRTACESKGQAKACVRRGHDRLARGWALHGGFELSLIYSYKLRFIAGDETRTHTPLRGGDFKSPVSTIPPRRLMLLGRM
jgi:hypothetical protein